MQISVSLVQPNWAQGVQGNYWLPYSVASVWCYAVHLPEFSDRIRLNQIVFRREHTDALSATLAQDDQVLFSCYVWNWQYNLTLARKIKQINPAVQIIFGGPQVSEHRLNQQILLYPFVDVWITSEGELSYAEYLTDYFNNSVKPRYSVQRLTDLHIPSVYTSGIFTELIQNNPDIEWSTTLETVRGCPFKCSFCDWGSLTYDRVYQFPEHRVQADIDWIADNQIVYVFVADANFGMFPERDLRIAGWMTAAQDRCGYPEVWNTNWHKNSRQNVIPILKQLTQGGRNRAMTISVQSMTPDVQTAIERRNMDSSHLKQMFDLINTEGLPSYTELILPLPLETEASWRSGLAQVLQIGQHNSIEVWFHQLLENATSNQSHIQQYQFEIRELTGYVSGIPEPGDDTPAESSAVVVATSTLSYSEFLDCWQYSSLIINFHCGGWSQVLSRYLVSAGVISYAEFYDKLFSGLNAHHSDIADQWRQQRTDLSDYLNGNPAQGFSGHTFLWNFNRILHQNYAETLRVIQDILDIPEITPELFRAQAAFVYNYQQQYPVILELNHNYLDYLKADLSGPAKSGKFRYQISGPETAASSLSQHLDWLYYRRRQGYGKTLIQPLNLLN